VGCFVCLLFGFSLLDTLGVGVGCCLCLIVVYLCSGLGWVVCYDAGFALFCLLFCVWGLIFDDFGLGGVIVLVVVLVVVFNSSYG